MFFSRKTNRAPRRLSESESEAHVLHVVDVHVEASTSSQPRAAAAPPVTPLLPPWAEDSNRSQHSLELDTEALPALPDTAADEAGSGWRYVGVCFYLSLCLSVYAKALHTSPLLTKAASSGLVFGASDWCAQGLAGGGATDWPRLLTCALIGALFGPAAHFWYGLMQRSFPRQRARDTLCKTVLGQTIFGPCFTVVFFAGTLCEQASGIGATFWIGLGDRLGRDFLPTQLAGLGFWSTVDLLSYSCIVPRLGEAWIPLFASAATFVWTIFLSFDSATRCPTSTCTPDSLGGDEGSGATRL